MILKVFRRKKKRGGRDTILSKDVEEARDATRLKVVIGVIHILKVLC